MRIETYEDDALVCIEDTRTVSVTAARQIAMLKTVCGKAILEDAPAYKQANVALGIYPPDQAEAIRAHIASCRAQCDMLEARINAAVAAAASDDDKAVCDAIEGVNWQ